MPALQVPSAPMGEQLLGQGQWGSAVQASTIQGRGTEEGCTSASATQGTAACPGGDSGTGHGKKGIDPVTCEVFGDCGNLSEHRTLPSCSGIR